MCRRMLSLLTATCWLLLLSCCYSVEGTFLKDEDLKRQTNTQWMSFDKHVEFLPADDFAETTERAARAVVRPNGFQEELRKLNLQQDIRRLGSSSSGGASSTKSAPSPYNVQPYVTGNVEYDEYQQAWRYLGFMIDCNDINWGEVQYDDDDRSGSGSWDGGTGEGCDRYVVWAAYVDLNYQGGGIGEYQFWDRWNKVWDATSCNYNSNGDDGEGGNRCAKMDCHLSDTHFSLLGFFKHKSYDDWMEQLFKHEGMCVWTDEEYAFMGSARNAWPQGCGYTGKTSKEGHTIYYDLKPRSKGRIGVGLYTDTRCVEEYKGSDSSITVENILGNFLSEGGGSGDYDNYDYGENSLNHYMYMWESAFDIFKTCQPCVAYDLNNVGYNTDDDASKGSSYGTYRYGYDDDYRWSQYGGGGADFDCYDDADYTNVNQCMKFIAKTTVNAATFRDLSLANTQGTLVDMPLLAFNSGKKDHGPLYTFMTGIFVILSTYCLCCGGLMLIKARKEARDYTANFSMKENLVFA